MGRARICVRTQPGAPARRCRPSGVAAVPAGMRSGARPGRGRPSGAWGVTSPGPDRERMDAFMTEVLDQTLPQAPNEADLAAAVQRILAASAEPLTPSKIRAQLPANLRGPGAEQLTDVLRRRVDAGVL